MAAVVAQPDHEESMCEDVHGLDLARRQMGQPEADRRGAYGRGGCRRVLLAFPDDAISLSFEFALAEPLKLPVLDAGPADVRDLGALAPAEVDVLLEREDEGRVREPLEIQERVVATDLRASDLGQVDRLRQRRLDVLELSPLRFRRVPREADDGVEHLPLFLDVRGVGFLDAPVAVEAAIPRPSSTS